MVERVAITIDQDGRVHSVLGEAETLVRSLGGGLRQITRASRIEPYAAILRLVWLAGRAVSGDSGVLADWLRGWRCRWRVRILHSGRIVGGVFESRAAALAFEVEHLNAEENFAQIAGK